MSMMEFKVLKVVLYVNDGICVGATKQATSQAARAWFVINEEKSDFEPRQRVTWLEFSLELNQGNVSGMDFAHSAIYDFKTVHSKIWVPQ